LFVRGARIVLHGAAIWFWLAVVQHTIGRLTSTLCACAWDAAVLGNSHENLFSVSLVFFFLLVGGASRLGGHAA
jgi:hypothetical protein